MKKIIIFIIILIVSGCVAHSKRLCTEYGFSPGSRDFSNCVMSEHHRFEDKWERRNTQTWENNRQNKSSITCKTKPDVFSVFGGSTTVCD